MTAAVGRQLVHRLPQLRHRTLLAHPLGKNTRKRILVENQIGCLHNEVLNRKLCIVPILTIARHTILHTDLRMRLLRRDIRPGTRQRRRSKPRRSLRCKSRTNTRRKPCTQHHTLFHMVHPISHVRITAPKHGQ